MPAFRVSRRASTMTSSSSRLWAAHARHEDHRPRCPRRRCRYYRRFIRFAHGPLIGEVARQGYQRTFVVRCRLVSTPRNREIERRRPGDHFQIRVPVPLVSLCIKGETSMHGIADRYCREWLHEILWRTSSDFRTSGGPVLVATESVVPSVT